MLDWLHRRPAGHGSVGEQGSWHTPPRHTELLEPRFARHSAVVPHD